MNSIILRQFYRQKGYPAAQEDAAVRAVENLSHYLAASGKALESAGIGDIRTYIARLTDRHENSEDTLRALARYFYLTDKAEIYIYFTSLFGSRGVLEHIHRQLAEQEGEGTGREVFCGLETPPLGTPPEELPSLLTCRLMHRLAACLPPERYRKALAGNNHEIPAESYLDEKRRYEEAASLNDYLKDLHVRKVAELQRHCDERKIWFEQEITQEVVDFAAANQEILSAVRKGNRLYVTKIPYDTVKYLRAKCPAEKKYYLCHCPFVRSVFLNSEEESGKEAALPAAPAEAPASAEVRASAEVPVSAISSVPADWCYCSAGFEKHPFEVIFGMALDVELLESPLMGHDRCRFAVILPPERIK